MSRVEPTVAKEPGVGAEEPSVLTSRELVQSCFMFFNGRAGGIYGGAVVVQWSQRLLKSQGFMQRSLGLLISRGLVQRSLAGLLVNEPGVVTEVPGVVAVEPKEP